MTNYNPAKEWFDYSRQTHDHFIEFIVRWMALNYLYEHWYTEKYIIGHQNRRIYGEDDRVEEFAKQHEAELKNAGFKFYPNNYPELCKKVIDSMRRTGNERKDQEIERNRNETFIRLRRGDVPALFRTIYYVRCNLMHGSKAPGNDRDRRLVKEGAEILGNILECLLKANIHLHTMEFESQEE